MNKRYYEHTLPIIRGSLSNTYSGSIRLKTTRRILRHRHGTILKRAGSTGFQCRTPFFMGDWIVFPLLTGKGLGLPRFCRKAAPFGGLVGQKKIILATLRYFLLPSLAQKGNPRAGGL